MQPQAAPQAAAQAATPAVVAAPAVVAVPVAGGPLSTRAPGAIPAQELPVFSDEEIANYQRRLMHYGLDPNPKRWIKNPYEWVGKRDAVKDHMLRLYEDAPLDRLGCQTCATELQCAGFLGHHRSGEAV